MARRSRIVWLPAVALAAAIAAGPAQAAEPPANAELAAWLADNTDVAPAQVALVTPDLIYGLEPLGPRSATDEVVGLARAEAFDGDWASSHGVQSWEAHLLFDCRGKRVRVIRSAEYVQRNRKGRPVATAEQGQWLSPSADQPAATLLAAACDPAFAWPLRTAATAPAAPVQTAGAESAAPKPSPPPPAAPATPGPTAKAEAAPPKPSPTFTIQIGRGPSHQGAREALKDARKVLGPAAAGLASEVEASHVGDRRRFTATLSGFPTAAAAAAACDRLHAGDHHCFVRAAPGPAPNADRDEAAAQLPSAPQPYAAAGPAPTAAPPLRGFVIQLTYGPSEEGARGAIDRARKALGPDAAKLTAISDRSEVGGRARYTALLGGFETAAPAVRACETLRKARQTCFARPAQATE